MGHHLPGLSAQTGVRQVGIVPRVTMNAGQPCDSRYLISDLKMEGGEGLRILGLKKRQLASLPVV